jgi:flagellar basal-body rod modification protein FlgD
MVGNVSKLTAGSNSQGTQLKSDKYALKTEDFINMMVTQLQNQDPMEPAKNEQLLAQMSQISQMESSSNLTKSIEKLTLQNSLSSAGSMIGKMIKGKDEKGVDIDGMVSSVRVQDGEIHLELDNGKKLPLGNVLSITTPSNTGQTAAPAA